MIILYFGPEVIMPLASAAAAAAGALLMFWRRVVGFVRAVFRRIRGAFSSSKGRGTEPSGSGSGSGASASAGAPSGGD